MDSWRQELPPELEALDAELSSIRYEERPSFAPELEAELAREWTALQGRRYWPIRQLMAAVLAGLLLVGMGVPSARAALVRFVGTIGDLVGVLPEEPAPVHTPVPEGALPAEEEVGPDAPAAPPVSVGPPPLPEAAERFPGPEATFPELLDRPRAEALIRRNYPIAFQRGGVGGVVGVLLWVDSTGSVGFVNLGRSSGIPELDRAALQVAPSLQFEPARRLGRAVGTWVEFDVRFEPVAGGGGEDWLPEVTPASRPSEASSPASLEAGDFLLSALGDDRVVARLGSVEDIVKGEPPAGRAPTQWRTEVVQVLEEAIVRAPDNPAPFLALSRVRQKQGLRAEAQVLLERGLRRVQRSAAAVSPRLLADLHFERGTLVKQSWLGSRNLGRVPSGALVADACSQAPAPGGASAVYAAVDRLIAWNYLCPEELGGILDRSFEHIEGRGATDGAITMASFRSAVEAYPAHAGANMEVLLGLAEERRWEDLLAAARRFVSASQGDPHGLLLAGMALQRLSRSEEADESFRSALLALPADQASQVEDVALLLVGPQAGEYASLSAEGQVAWRDAFWQPLDPILTTPVNERRVEHLSRTSYALMRFGSTRSDPGEVWVRYGQPTEIRAFEEGPGVRMELWDYGPGPDLTFRRLADSDEPALTPEGKAYLEEVRQLVPHRYGEAARQVFALQAQVARFEDPAVGVGDVEMHTRVPVLFASGGQDSLDVGLLLLGKNGSTVSVTHARVPAVEGDVSLKARTRDGLAGVVVEMYSPASGQAAALRRSMPPLAEASRAVMSDLVLTAPASPARAEVARGALWLEPLALDRPVQGPAIGAYFEIYRAAGISPWYRLRAELEDRTTGELRDLPIQPAGESGFRTTWDRRPTAEPVTAEFVSVWLSGVPPGRYLLRVVADVPGAGARISAEQALDRR